MFECQCLTHQVKYRHFKHRQYLHHRRIARERERERKREIAIAQARAKDRLPMFEHSNIAHWGLNFGPQRLNVQTSVAFKRRELIFERALPTNMHNYMLPFVTKFSFVALTRNCDLMVTKNNVVTSLHKCCLFWPAFGCLHKPVKKIQWISAISDLFFLCRWENAKRR